MIMRKTFRGLNIDRVNVTRTVNSGFCAFPAVILVFVGKSDTSDDGLMEDRSDGVRFCVELIWVLRLGNRVDGHATKFIWPTFSSSPALLSALPVLDVELSRAWFWKESHQSEDLHKRLKLTA